jgi:hypothetical protein
MNDLPKLGQSFRGAASMSSRQAAVQERVREALTRMNERFEKCEPQLTLERYRELLIKQGSAPELKPDGRHDNPGNRLWKAARFSTSLLSESSPNSIEGDSKDAPVAPISARSCKCASIPRARREMSSITTTWECFRVERRNLIMASMPGRFTTLPDISSLKTATTSYPLCSQ